MIPSKILHGRPGGAVAALLAFTLWPAEAAVVAPPDSAPAAGAPATAALAPRTNPGDPEAPDLLAERWYTSAIGGQEVGALHERLTREPAGSLRLATGFRLVLNRMGKRVEMASRAVSRESPAGHLESVEVELQVSRQVTHLRARVNGDTLEIEQQAGEDTFARSVAFTGEILGPEGLRRLTVARLDQPGDEIRYQIFSPELGSLTGAARRVLGLETVQVQGRPVRALKVRETLDASPLPSTLWLDGEGHLLRLQQAGPFGPVEVVRADAAAAARATAGNALPEERYAATLVHSQVRIPQPRRLEWLKLALHHRNPDLGWPELSGPGQTVVAETREALTLTVERLRPRSGQAFPVAVSEANRPYLEANAYLQSDRPELRAAAQEIVAGERDLFQAALKLERWVAESMSFDLGVVLAPSVEVFAERRGTCTEYAILLATLVRAVGIPSRLVMGFVYVDGVFGGHAWTEVLVGEEWIPLDAAIVGDGPADAARFAFQRSSLAAGPGELNLGPAAQLYGHIDARVLEIGVAGEARRTFSPHERPYTVEGDLYRNPGLDLEVRKPEGFTFVDLDQVWPQSTVVGLKGPEGVTARLEVQRRPYWQDGEEAARRQLLDTLPQAEPGSLQVGERAAAVADSPEAAALALPVGGETWILRAQGPQAPEVLRRIARGLTLPASQTVEAGEQGGQSRP